MSVVICPGCNRSIDLIPDELFLPSIQCAVCDLHFCPRTGEALYRDEAAMPLLDTSYQTFAPMPEPQFQCWSCGKMVAASEVVRRDMATEQTRLASWSFDANRGYTAYRSERVNLCRRCVWEADRADARSSRMLLYFGCLPVLILFGIGLACFWVAAMATELTR